MKRVFFLINNNFHLVDLLEHLGELDDYEVHLICIPHTFDEKKLDASRFASVTLFESPFKVSFLRQVFGFYNIFQAHSEMIAKINPNGPDVLIMYTEFELLNQFVAQMFKRAGARVYVLDEGLGTYLTYGQTSEKPPSMGRLFKVAWYKYILGYSWLKMFYYNQCEFPQMQDNFIDAVLLYRPLSIKREMPTVLINSNHGIHLDLDDNTCIFINSDMYNFYISWNEYQDELMLIMQQLTTDFDKVYFKFHPREKEKFRNNIKRTLSVFSDIRFIESDAPVENMLTDIKPKYAVSYLSTSLLTLMDYGVQPVYLFDLMPSCKNLAVSKGLKEVMHGLGVRLPIKLSEMKNNSYGVRVNSNVKLSDFLKEN